MPFIYRKYAKPIEYFHKDDCPHQYVHWKLATQEGQWALTDDEYVVRVKRVKKTQVFVNRKGEVGYVDRIDFDYGCRWKNRNRPYLFMEYVDKRGGGIKPTEWWRSYDRRYPHLKTLLAHLVVSGKLRMAEDRRYTKAEYDEFIKVAYAIFGEASTHRNWFKVRTFFNHEGVRMELIQDEVDKLLEEYGITVKKTMEMYAAAEEVARKTGNGKLLLDVAKEYRDLLNIKKQRQTQTMPPGLPPPSTDGGDETFRAVIEHGKTPIPEKGVEDATIVE